MEVPGDKSISHRAIMFSALANGSSTIKGLLRGEDVLRTLAAFESMGVKIDDQGDSLTVHGAGLFGLRPPGGPLDMGNSGTGMRLMSGILAGQSFDSTLIGDESLSSRPMHRIIEPLHKMGARIESTEAGTAPLRIQGRGRLRPISYELPVASAQVKSCIMLAGLYAEGRTQVIEPAVCRDHTERMLEAFGARVEREGRCISLWGKPALTAQDINVPGDFSSAAFFIVAALLVPGSEFRLERVGINPSRTGLLKILERMGADIGIENRTEIGGEPVADLVVRHQPLQGVTVSGEDVPLAIDEFPILSVAASLAQGTTEFRDAAELRKKESDRIEAMAEGLRGMGVSVITKADGMIIEGSARLKAAQCESFGDHRVAMSLLVAGLVAEGKTSVTDTAPIRTSFPNFYKYLTQLLS